MSRSLSHLKKSLDSEKFTTTAPPFTGFPRRELQERSRLLTEALDEEGFDGALFFQNSDLYYLTGTVVKGLLYVPAGEKHGKEIRGDIQFSGQFSGQFPGQFPGILFVIKDFGRAVEVSNYPNILPLKKLSELPDALKKEGLIIKGTMGLEMDVLPAKNFLYLKKLFPDVEFADVSPIIRKIRAIKSPLEKGLIKRAAEMQAEMFGQVPSLFFPGIREIDIQAEIEALYRKMGHQGIVRLRAFNQELFYGVVVSGPSGSLPAYLDGPVAGTGLTPSFPLGGGVKEIKRDEPILIDMVGNFGGYISDASRLFYIGKLPERARDAYGVAMEIEKSFVSMAEPGIETGELFSEALKIARGAGFSDNFMGINGRGVNFMGHGIGLELDELPVIHAGGQDRLKEGNVIALEPKFIFEDIGAVGLEDSFYIGPSGPERLTTMSLEPVEIKP